MPVRRQPTRPTTAAPPPASPQAFGFLTVALVSQNSDRFVFVPVASFPKSKSLTSEQCLPELSDCFTGTLSDPAGCSSASFNLFYRCSDAQIVPDLAGGSPFPLAPVSSVLCPSFFEHFLLFWDKRMPWVQLVLCCSSPAASHFFREPWIVSVGKEFRLRSGCCVCSLLLGCCCSQWVEPGEMCLRADISHRHVCV